ncbi:hypothetical protein LUZ61_019935 [Rhynchospora tenuis]|uniref:F-box domain-containing protein n=1 Tax=Rhynchospora tenuis TaxID=198213 RepID=A0AAD5ZCB1_9POAL|nr:hypothetical protein LUZ61_019935 [Rhynchospora tenuis]
MRGPDRISELHDSILTHILSYLPTKEAVGTRILSKRWRNMWASVPVLDFGFADFTDDKYTVFKKLKCHVTFVSFVDSVLASRQVQQLDSFRLVWNFQDQPYSYLAKAVRRWIHHVVQQWPRVLSIYLEPHPTFQDVIVPDPTFTCSSLEELKLHINDSWHKTLNPALVTLPHLRKLNLGYFTIKPDFMDRLLLGSPSLEELELYACCLDISQISCGGLKSLVIDGCCHMTEIEVSIPSLQYLKFTVMSSQREGFVFTNMSSLVKASICLLDANALDVVICDSKAKILAGLLGVTTLDIVLYGSDAMDMLDFILKTCPYFENLKFMHFESFDGCMAECIDMIDHLVQHSPALEEFTFYRCQDDSNDVIELVDELREVMGKYGIARLVECHQGCIYGSPSELEELLDEYLNCFQSMEEEESTEEDEGEASSVDELDEGEEAEEHEGEASSADEVDEGGEEEDAEEEASSADEVDEGEVEEEDEGEASSAEEDDEEDEEEEDEADEYAGGAIKGVDGV